MPRQPLTKALSNKPQFRAMQQPSQFSQSFISQGSTDGLPWVVLLPGTLCDSRIFARQARALRGKAQVLKLDYAKLTRSANWCQRLLKKLPETFAIAGFSLGGLWALELLRTAPERITGLALIASNAEAASPAGRRKSRHLWRLWRKPIGGGPREVAKLVKPGYFHHPAQRRLYAEMVQSMALATPNAAARAEFAWAASRPDGKPALAQFDNPVLIVSGAKDRLCPRPLQQAMHNAQPKAHWLEIARCGHFVPLEAPAALNAALQRWVSALPGSVGAKTGKNRHNLA